MSTLSVIISLTIKSFFLLLFPLNISIGRSTEVKFSRRRVYYLLSSWLFSELREGLCLENEAMF
uniref:Uncharacterized protein n=1 Tax=Anguilla anguilla TaxID=7936 RepID=A0A0E9UIL1_ANGAN